MSRSEFIGVTFAFLAGFFIMSLVFPYVILLFIFWTAGLAAYLTPLNTVFIYALAAVPALIGTRAKPYNWRLIGCSIVLIPLVAVVPPLISRHLTLQRMQRLVSTDVTTDFKDTPKSIELAEEGRVTSFLAHPGDCLELCQRLLLSRQVDVVRVMKAKGHGGFDYRLERREVCPDDGPATRLMLPEIKDALMSGTCLVARDSDASPTAVRIEIRTTKFSDDYRFLAQDLLSIAGVVKSTDVLTISTPEQDGWSAKLRKTKVAFSYWALPLFLHLRIRPVEQTLNDIDLDQFALRTLGIKEADIAQPLTPRQRVALELDHIGNRGPTATQDGLIEEWVQAFSPCKPWTCPPLAREDAELLLRLIRDRRIENYYRIAEIVLRNPGFPAAHLDLLLDEMVARGASSRFTLAMGPAIARLDIDKLRERRDVILPLIRSQYWEAGPAEARGISVLAGRLGVDTSDLILERLRRRESAHRAAMAACMADAAVGQKLVPALLDEVHRADGFRDRYALAALIRFGHFEEIKAVARKAWPKLAEKAANGRSDADLADDISLCDPD